MKISEDINDGDMKKNVEPEKNKTLNKETGSIYQNNRTDIIEHWTEVNNRDMETTTNEIVDSAYKQC